MTKKGRQFYEGINRVTPSVAAPGDTNLSDATDYSKKHTQQNLRMCARLTD